MSKTLFIIPLLFMLVPPSAACAQAPDTARADSLRSVAQQQPAAQTQSFTTVEGADLAARLAEASRKARAAAPQTPYWTAYAFDVRPGVAVDPVGSQFSGSMHMNGDTSVFIGTSQGVRVETPDLAVFVLREPGRGDAVTRMEVYNLRRPREYSGYPVYWAARASNEESLNYLRGLAESHPKSELQERAALALALHDDARVAGLLKNFARASRNMRVRKTAVFWLGQTGGETEYLAGLVRDERENEELRETAAHAIGESRDQQALTALQGLYGAIRNREVRQAIIHAVAENENRDAAYAFLLRVARGDADREAREQAVHQLGEGWQEAALDDLMRIYAADRDMEVRQQVVHAVGEIEGARAEAKLVEIARTGEHPDLREQAIHQLGEKKTDAAFDELSKIFAAERNQDVREKVLHAFSEMETKRAEEKLIAVARDRNEHKDVRQHALHWLGERGTDAALDELIKIYDGEPSVEIREQVLQAFGEMKSKRAEDKLFEIARSAPHEELRREALQRLGEMASERSLTLLSNTVSSTDEKTEVQVEAVRAISEKPVEQSVPLLIKVARTHPNAEVRKEAVRHLGESGDPRAVEFFRELLSK